MMPAAVVLTVVMLAPMQATSPAGPAAPAPQEPWVVANWERVKARLPTPLGLAGLGASGLVVDETLFVPALKSRHPLWAILGPAAGEREPAPMWPAVPRPDLPGIFTPPRAATPAPASPTSPPDAPAPLQAAPPVNPPPPSPAASPAPDEAP